MDSEGADPYLPSTTQRIISCAMLASFSVFGLLCTVHVLRFFFKRLRQLTPFNIICASRCSLNLLALLCYFFYQLPLAILSAQDASIARNGILTGMIANIYVEMEYISCLLAINRFVAICFWNHYTRIFNKKLLLLVISLLFLERAKSVALIACQLLINNGSCSLTFDGVYITWTNVGNCTNSTDSASSFTYYFIAIVVVVNLLTFLRLLYIYKTSSVQSSIDIKSNGILFLQTICQDLLFVVDMLFMTKLYAFIDSPLWYFICFEFTGLLVHSLDSAFLILFQPEIRKHAKGKTTTVGSIKNGGNSVMLRQCK